MSAPSAISRAELGALRSISRRGVVREYCELCHTILGSEHQHLLQRSDRQILCACEACVVLFSHRTHERAFLRIPCDARRLSGFAITDADWAALRLPIDLAFFATNSSEGRVIAYYPSPAGPTESHLDLGAWSDLVVKNPMLGCIQPDVEALLVNRTRGRRDYFIAPIDQCYKLTGLIRRKWRGLSGGDEAWRAVAEFFEALAGSAQEVPDA